MTYSSISVHILFIQLNIFFSFFFYSFADELVYSICINELNLLKGSLRRIEEAVYWLNVAVILNTFGENRIFAWKKKKEKL